MWCGSSVAGVTSRLPSVTRVWLVSRVRRNPYVSLLCDALNNLSDSARHGTQLLARTTDQFSANWMWRQRRECDVLHIHWLELLFVHPSWARSLRRWLSTMAALLLARLLGVRVVYTVHNLGQHEGRRPGLAWLGHVVMFALAQAVHVHDAETAAQLARGWRRRRGVYVIPHGSYVGAYPNRCTRAEARAELGLDEGAFVYLFLGRVRPYKGLEDLVAAFRRVADARAVLLVAGEVQDPGYDTVVRALAGNDERVRLSLTFVAEEQLQVYLNACDITVLPYRHVTTSGAAVLSFSFAVPIIAPRIGCFAGLVGANAASDATSGPTAPGVIEGVRGLLYKTGDEAYLAEALQRARSCDLQAMRGACREYAQTLDWRAISAQHAAMYQAGTRTGA